MKILTLALALAGLASTAPLNAQILSRLPGSNQTTVNGSWTLVGRDGSGNQIYERRVQDRNGNIVVQRARRDVNGNMSIISSNTVNVGNNGNNGNNGTYGNNRNNDCTYAQSTNTVGDIIFGRTSAATNCDDRNSRVAGGWYQVGREGNSRVYERQTTDNNGNVIIQHARRNSNGSFTILNTRVVRNKSNNGRGRGRGNNGRNNNDDSYNTSYNNGGYNNASYNNGQNNKDSQKQQKEQNKEWQKQQKQQDKENKKDAKHDNGHGD
jgi:hypothetical protein